MAEQAMERIQRQLAYAAEEKKKANAPAPTTAAPKKKELSEAVKAGIAAGNINITTDSNTRTDLLASSKAIQQRDETLLAEFDRRKVARQLALPTDDEKVKQMLREHGHPICLFAEGPADRRERLREVLAVLGEEAILRGTSEAPKREEKKEAEVWYHEGPDALIEARLWIAEYSLPRARDRLKAARIELALVDDETKRSQVQAVQSRLATMSIYGSQVGDARPLSCARFSPDSRVLATSSWSGLCRLWSVPDCAPIATLRGHTERVGNIDWHPRACVSQDKEDLNLASCAADGSIALWALDQETPIGELENCGTRVARVGFHPSGRFLAGTCYDSSWRLWDLVKGVATMQVDESSESSGIKSETHSRYTGSEILYQEGHSREVYGLAFHPDGSLIGTTSLDSSVRIWDLRSGRNVLVLQGHVSGVLGVSFAADGHTVASGSDDHTVRLWDLRTRGELYTLPAHTGLVSDVQFPRLTSGPVSSEVFVTSSYDNTARVWTSPECAPLATLTGHEGKVMAVDIAPDLSYIATASYDRTFKFWAPEKVV